MKKSFICVLLCSFFLFNPIILKAQSIRCGGGIAGVENFGSQFNFGIAFSLPITSRVSAELSYDRWQGDDENYISDLADPDFSSNAHYYGKSGLNYLISYNFYDSKKISSSIAAGLGRYEQRELDISGNENSFYISTFSVSPMLKFKFSAKVAAYARVLVSTKELTEPPDWGIFSMGLEVSPF
jgi:hypothetical protein